MTLFPNGQCPKCSGVITFFDVLSILTPFQCIYCVHCGEMVFLRNKWMLTFVSLMLATVTIVAVFAFVSLGWASHLTVYLSAFVFLCLSEWVATVYVILTKGLVVRRKI